jgi:glycosyltransferase 2 family protein
MTGRMLKKLFTIVKVLISVFLIIFLFSKVNFGDFFGKLKQANSILVIVAALLFYTGTYFSILRWNKFVKFYRIVIDKWSLFRMYLIGAFLNNFLPSSIGGDGYKVFALAKQYPNQKKEILSSIIYERGNGFLLLLIINVICFIGFYRRIAIHNQIIFFIEVGILIATFVAIVFRKAIVSILGRLRYRIAILDKAARFFTVLFSFDCKRSFIVASFYSVLFILNAAIGAWILFVALGIRVNLAYIVFASTFSQILGILPISINSIGITEGATVFAYSIIGIPPEISLAMALIARVSMMVTSSAGGLLLVRSGQRKAVFDAAQEHHLT